MIEIIIQLTESDAKFLRHWASVGRTIDNTLSCLADLEFKAESTYGDLDIAYEELKDLKGPLDNLHHIVRGALIEKGIQ